MGNIPKTFPEFRDLVIAVADHWGTDPATTVLYCTQAEFATDAGDFADLVNLRITTGSTRPAKTRLMENLDRQITAGLPNVKAAIAAKWGADSATAYYPQFGIEHLSDGWVIPPDHNKRPNALLMMKGAISTNALSVLTYDLAFWASMQTQYAAAVLAANSIDGTVSEQIGDRDVIMKRLHRVLVSLLFILRGNHPDNYHSVYRSYGFQAEDYG